MSLNCRYCTTVRIVISLDILYPQFICDSFIYFICHIRVCFILQRAVDRLPYERGRTRIDKALEIASRDVFPFARKGVHQIAMVITDGQQTQQADTKDLRTVSEPLRKAGVQVLALGVGPSVNPDELRLIVERDQDVLLTKSFKDLLVNVNNLIKTTCEIAGNFLNKYFYVTS